MAFQEEAAVDDDVMLHISDGANMLMTLPITLL